ncbi:MAG: hypothetical protein AAB295_05050 [Chloroflexota bacterium]
MSIDDRDLAIAREHPRGTERRALLAYREALNDVARYARLPAADRDVIVRWVEIRRRLAEDSGLDHDARNLADPLLPYQALRAHVLAGERAAHDAPPVADPGGDLREVVARIRAR